MVDPGDVVNILPQGNLTEDLGLVENSFVLEAMMQLQELPREERRRRNINFVKSTGSMRTSSQTTCLVARPLQLNNNNLAEFHV